MTNRLGCTLLAVILATGILVAQATKIATSATLPTHCTVGNVYLKTGTSPGLYTCLATDTWTLTGSGTPGGSDTQVQFNDAGTFGGSSNLTLHKADGTLWGFGSGASSTDIPYFGLWFPTLTVASSTGDGYASVLGISKVTDSNQGASFPVGGWFEGWFTNATDVTDSFAESVGILAMASTTSANIAGGLELDGIQTSVNAAGGTHLSGAGIVISSISATGGASFDNKYGLNIGDQTGGLVANYAIKTGAGLVSLGDAMSTGGTTPAVANVGANSCGTTTATIAGNDNAGTITVGATSGSQCRVTFVNAAATRRECTVTDETTTIATRAAYVDASNTDFLGSFGAGDLVSYVCFAR